MLALQEARQAARVDSLTGALNHGAMLARLEEEIDRARRYRTGLAALIIDLDDFKSINDRWGHATGDSVLRQVASLLRTEFRAHDQVARYGGDEFVVLLPHAVGPRAEIAARRALRRLRDIHVVTDEGRRPLSASLGLAEWAEPETPAELLAKADQALLAGQARRQGPAAHGDAASGRGTRRADDAPTEPAGPQPRAGERRASGVFSSISSFISLHGLLGRRRRVTSRSSHAAAVGAEREVERRRRRRAATSRSRSVGQRSRGRACAARPAARAA